METPLAVTGTGMVTGVGLSAPASCAAIRCALDNFQETRFMDQSGEWLMGSQVPLSRPWRGETKLVKMATQAIRECMDGREELSSMATPLLLCLPETERLGRSVSDDDELLREVQEDLGQRFHERSQTIPRGHVSVAVALQKARWLLTEPGVRHVIVAATDSLLAATALADYEEKQRLLTATNSDGFIPGEAAAAVVLELMHDLSEPRLVCQGLGFGVEKAHIDSEEPLRADGLTEAIKGALGDAGCDESVLQFKIIDVSGTQYHFKEASLAFSRLDRTKRTEFDVWHPADCVGEVGAAIGPIMIGVLKAAFEKGYAKGSRVLMHMGNDDGKRAALVFAWQAGH
jgi:3-oxoacyl-[acyl-carrier-protein] synthase-1